MLSGETMRVLVVGGCGYIGSLVVDRLIEEGHNVTVYDNLLYEERYMKNVAFIFGCITETDKLAALASDYDFVIWLAALVGDPACEVDKELTQKLNYEAVRDFCNVADPKIKLIYYSTCSVYGISEGILTEESPVNPISAYAVTKYAAEEPVLKRGGIVFRLGTVFGLSDTYSRIRLDLVVNVMTMKAFLDKELTVNGGNQWRPIISVIDIAEFTVRAVITYKPGVYILSYRNITIDQLGHEIAELTGSRLIKNALPYQDLRNYIADGTKAIQTFNYQPKITVAEEVYRLYKIFSENRIKDLFSLKYHNGQYLRHHHEPIGAKI